MHIGPGKPDHEDPIKRIDDECAGPRVLGGPTELLTLTPSAEAAACIAAADAVVTAAGEPMRSPWPTGQVCK